MFELPMLMFRMTGIDSLIELTMDEVWGFTDSTSYGGGYAAKGIISIKSCNYSAKDTHYFTTGELYCFAQELNKCYTSLNGVAVLHNIERELELECAFNKFGHVIIIGNQFCQIYDKSDQMDKTVYINEITVSPLSVSVDFTADYGQLGNTISTWIDVNLKDGISFDYGKNARKKWIYADDSSGNLYFGFDNIVSVADIQSITIGNITVPIN